MLDARPQPEAPAEAVLLLEILHPPTESDFNCPAETSVHIGRRKGDRHRDKGHVPMETDTGVMWLQAKECLEPPEAGRDRGRWLWRYTLLLAQR